MAGFTRAATKCYFIQLDPKVRCPDYVIGHATMKTGTPRTKICTEAKERQLHPEVVNENIVRRVLMITFKISKFVARYDIEPIILLMDQKSFTMLLISINEKITFSPSSEEETIFVFLPQSSASFVRKNY